MGGYQANRGNRRVEAFARRAFLRAQRQTCEEREKNLEKERSDGRLAKSISRLSNNRFSNVFHRIPAESVAGR